MIKYIVFDVDRTLVDSFEPELLSFGEAMKKVTGIGITEELSNMFISMPTKVFLKKLNISDEQIKQIKKEWENTFPKYRVTCFNGIKEIIKELSKMGYIMGLVTSRTIDEFHELDEELSDVIDLFKVIVTSDKVNIPKPNKASMDYLCNELSCISDEVLYIGDSSIDKEFAINADCLFIPACYDNKELINEENACLNPKDLLNIIKRIGSDNMKYREYYVTDKEGNSNCVIRSFCKIYNEEYNDVLKELLTIQKELNSSSFNDIEVFELYMKRRNTEKIDCNNDLKIKDIKLDNGSYIIFCWDKKDFYHMVTIIDNTLYDRTSESFELYPISIYKKTLTS